MDKGRPLSYARSGRRRRAVAIDVVRIVTFALIMVACQQEAQPSVRLALSCGNGPDFLPGDLQGQPSDPGADPVGRALARFLSTNEASFARLPPAGWLRVAANRDNVLFLAPSRLPDARFAMVVLRQTNGDWAPEAWGGCEPVVRGGSTFPAQWALVSRANGEATSFEVWIRPTDCATGQPLGDRLLPPIVNYGDTSVTVTWQTAAVVRNSQAVACPAEVPARTTLVLSQPLGERELLDGGVYPARPVEIGMAP